MLPDSLRITFADSLPVWRSSVVALDRNGATAPVLLAQEMSWSDGVTEFSITPLRNCGPVAVASPVTRSPD